MSGTVDQLNQCTVGERIFANHLRCVGVVVFVAQKLNLNLGGIVDDVIVGEDEAVLPCDDEARTGGLGSLLSRTPSSVVRHVVLIVLAPGFPTAWPEEPTEKVFFHTYAPHQEV